MLRCLRVFFSFRDNVEWDEAQEKAALAKIEENSKNLVSPTDRGDYNQCPWISSYKVIP